MQVSASHQWTKVEMDKSWRTVLDTTYWVRRCDRCGKQEVYSVKGPKPQTTEGYCNHCRQQTQGVWVSGDPNNDWRLMGQEKYLAGIVLRRMPYFLWSETWEHDRCEFCMAKFIPADEDKGVEPEHAGKPIQHAGYTNEGVSDQRDHYWWICDECFEDFRDRFGWTLATDS